MMTYMVANDVILYILDGVAICAWEMADLLALLYLMFYRVLSLSHVVWLGNQSRASCKKTHFLDPKGKRMEFCIQIV